MTNGSNGRIWSINYTVCGKVRMVTGLTKAEAKKAWRAYVMTYGLNANMSSHSSEGNLQRNYRTVSMKNGDWWFLRGELMLEGIWQREDVDDYISRI